MKKGGHRSSDSFLALSLSRLKGRGDEAQGSITEGLVQGNHGNAWDHFLVLVRKLSLTVCLHQRQLLCFPKQGGWRCYLWLAWLSLLHLVRL